MDNSVDSGDSYSYMDNSVDSGDSYSYIINVWLQLTILRITIATIRLLAIYSYFLSMHVYCYIIAIAIEYIIMHIAIFRQTPKT